MPKRLKSYSRQFLPEIRQVRYLQDLKENIKNAEELLICVAFVASWCGPCRKIAKYFPEIIQNFPDVYLIIINVEDSERLFGVFNIRMVPSFMLIRNKTILEIFTDNRYSRLLRRLKLHTTSDKTELDDIKRICDLLKDELYMLDLTIMMERFSSIIEGLGLICDQRKQAWDEQTQRFIEAFEKVQREKVLMINYGDIVKEDEEEFEPSTSKETKDAKKHKDGRFAKLINLAPDEEEIHLKMKEIIAQEDLGPRGSSVIREISPRSSDSSLGGTPDYTCRLGIEIEDRTYTAHEVTEILKTCQEVCNEQRIEERKQFIDDMRNMEITREDVIPFENLFISSSEDDLPKYSPRLQENMLRLAAEKEKKLKFKRKPKYDYESSDSDSKPPQDPVLKRSRDYRRSFM